MKEHPIPQDITGYRFHIVGNMTLKQFGELLLATIICFAIFSTNLPAAIMWPLIIFVAILGVVAAFVPIEERPLSHWLITFYGILYKPTQFFWQRLNNIPEAFLFKGNEEDIIQVKEVDLTPIRRQRIKEFISSSAMMMDDSDDFTYEERTSMQQVLTLFDTTGQLHQPTGQIEPDRPDLKIRVRSIRQEPQPAPQPEAEQLVEAAQPAQTEQPAQTQQPVETTPSVEAAPQVAEMRITPTAAPAPPPVPKPIIETASTDIGSDQKTVFLETQQVAQGIEIPQSQSIAVTKEGEQKAEDDIESDLVSDRSEKAFLENKAHTEEEQAPTQSAQFNADLPFPDKPDVPNKLVGMVLTANKELIPGAIVEIQTKDGQVVRAVRTNALGQFFVTTPLKNNTYTIAADKDGYTFRPQSIELKGKIVEPLEIIST
ncbi:MAG: hypothetical protein WDZ94_05170 [Patescibacteria group bacterium]